MVTEGQNVHAGGREVCVVRTELCLSVSLQSSSEVGGSAGEFDSSQRIESFSIRLSIKRFVHYFFFFFQVENSIKTVTKHMHSKHRMFS